MLITNRDRFTKAVPEPLQVNQAIGGKISGPTGPEGDGVGAAGVAMD